MVHEADFHICWQQAVNQLERLHNRVKEGHDLEAAVEFARWLRASRICEILSSHDNNGCLKVDSAFLRWKANELESAVCERYARGQNAPKGESSQLEQINHKLDLIAGRLAKVPIVEPTGLETGCGPNLSVITGGAAGDGQEGGEKDGKLTVQAERRQDRGRRVCE